MNNPSYVFGFFQIAVEQLYFSLRIFSNVHWKITKTRKGQQKTAYREGQKQSSLKISLCTQLLAQDKQFLLH